MEHLHAGKVRDLYSDGDDLILVASDRVSVYDVVLPTPIPDKGALLTQLSVWWFERLADIVPNHLISATDVPAEFGRNAIRCKRLDMLPVECVVRGYLTGGGLREYRATGSVSGIKLPDGLDDGSQLPEPLFTPSTKAPQGEHDEPISYEAVVDRIGADTAEKIRETSLRLYTEGAKHAADKGILIADTKFEFGLHDTGDDVEIVLADEVLTSDSSRFWDAADWEPGRPQKAFDKQMVRDWATSTGWDKTPPGPEIPADVVAATRERYVEAYEWITGLTW